MRFARGVLEREGLPPRALLAGASLVALLVVAAVALLHRGGDGPRKTAPATAGTTVFRVAVPPDWSPERRGLPLAGLRPSSAVGLHHRLLHVRFAAGVLPASSPTLLPAQLLAGLRGRLPRRQTVVLGGAQAYYYPSLRHPDSPGPLDMYVVPTTAGVVTMSCISAPAAAAALSACDEVAESVRLLRGRPLPVGPHAAFAERLPPTLRRLDAARRAAQASLSSRPERPRQIADIEALGEQYGGAARVLAPLVGTRPAWRQTVVDLLQRLAQSYRGAAALLRVGELSEFQIAARSTAARVRALQHVLGIPRRGT
jgi:hypothetical protein